MKPFALRQNNGTCLIVRKYKLIMDKNNKKVIIIFPLIICLVAVGGYILGKRGSYSSNSDVEMFNKIQNLGSLMPSSKLGQVLSLINNSYVDSINLDTLTEEFIPKVLHKLDPHSSYIPAKDAKEATENLMGEFDGIGVMFNMLTDTVIIQNVISGGPAEKVGVLSGDRIMMINDSLVAGKKINQNNIVKKLKGVGGTTVNISVQREGVAELLKFDIIRGKIPIKSIDAAFMVSPNVGYIKLLQFARTTHTEFVSAVEELKKQGMTKLIFDLADNTGGYLEQAILIANEFLPKDKMIVYTKGRLYSKEEQYSNGEGRLQDQELVVMINEGSASSSEIVAGALQDNDRGTLIGRRSFGKGLVQQQIPFNDGSILNVTIARYYTPTGRCIQRPYDKGYDEYYKDFFNRYVHSELINKDSIQLSDSLKFTTPKGKVVYGGGGIMPDVFVPIDTTLFSKELRKVLVDNTLFKYTIRYTDAHRKELTDIKTLPELEKYFNTTSDKMYNELISFAAANGKKVNLSKADRELAMNYVRAYIARNSSASDNGFYMYFNKFDNIFQKSLENISSEGN